LQRRVGAFERRAIVDVTLVRAAVAITIVGDDNDDAAFILTRRPLTLRRHAGQWALPGGRADESESASDAALRELHEEVGLELDDNDVIGALDDFETRSGFVITPVVVWGPAQPTLVPDPAEVHAVHCVPLETLDAPGVPKITQGTTSQRPLIRFPLPLLATTVWAPTAAMLYQAREVLLHGRATRVSHFEQPRWAWK
jgi:8-oxo-dGTP pyrophosphatase MutT (NUDIX family)